MSGLTSLIPAIQWYEGMLLSPQHFQQQDRRWQQILSYQLKNLAPHHWGVQILKFDPVSLPTGLLRVLELEAIMPDGLILSFAARPGDKQIELDIIAHKQKIIDTGAMVYLCVPEYTQNTSAIVGEWPRYTSSEGEAIPDENVVDNVIQIPRLEPKVSLVISDTPPARYVSMPIARLGFEDESFVLKKYLPPCLNVPQLSLLGERCGLLVRRLREKSAYLSEKWQSQIGTPLIAETSAQMRPLVQSLPLLEPLLLSNQVHPYQLYQVICQIAGQLSTLRLGQIPPIFPPYNHNDLLHTFAPLFEWINIVIDSIEKAYSVLMFALRERAFSVLLQYEIFTPTILIGLRAPAAMSETELSDWMREAIVASESHVESARIRRITGAPRVVLQDEELYDLLPGRGVLIFRIEADPHFIKPGERLVILNPADSPDKRPVEIVLYLRHKDIALKMQQSPPPKANG